MSRSYTYNFTKYITYNFNPISIIVREVFFWRPRTPQLYEKHAVPNSPCLRFFFPNSGNDAFDHLRKSSSYIKPSVGENT